MAKKTEEMPGTTPTEEDRVAIAINSGGTTAQHTRGNIRLIIGLNINIE